MHITIIVPEKDSRLDDVTLAHLPDLYCILGYRSPTQVMVERIVNPALTSVEVCLQANRHTLNHKNYRWFREQVQLYLGHFTAGEVKMESLVIPGT